MKLFKEIFIAVIAIFLLSISFLQKWEEIENKQLEQEKLICDNGYTSGWVDRVDFRFDGGMVMYYKYDERKYYKIPGGVTCWEEERII